MLVFFVVLRLKFVGAFLFKVLLVFYFFMLL